jgi:hypothetical protein
MEYMEYKDEDIYALHPKARLRNEGKYVIAAFPDGAAVPLIRMDPITAVIVTLFDGKRTCAEVADITSVMVHQDSTKPAEDTKTMISSVIKVHTEAQGGALDPLLVPLSKIGPADRARIPTFRTTD